VKNKSREIAAAVDRILSKVESLIQICRTFTFYQECAADVTSQMDAAASRETLATDQNRDSQEIT
jgi:hypothetical protein